MGSASPWNYTRRMRGHRSVFFGETPECRRLQHDAKQYGGVALAISRIL
jgi:hypothetical protein